jgi:hypothetical protein
LEFLDIFSLRNIPFSVFLLRAKFRKSLKVPQFQQLISRIEKPAIPRDFDKEIVD